MIEVKNLSFSYQNGKQSTLILRELSFSIRDGEWIAIHGSSGSGKSTLFYLLGTLHRPSSGTVTIDGSELTQMSPQDQAQFRNRHLGFVFQQFHLLPKTTVFDNIALAFQYPTYEPLTQQHRKKIESVANRVGLGDFLHRKTQELSGGQQQRVAVARSLVRGPSILLADEPTGNLDSKSAQQVMDLFRELHAEGHTIVMITHDPLMSAQCQRIITLQDGAIVHDSNPVSPIDDSTHESSKINNKNTTKRFISEHPEAWSNLLRRSLPLAWSQTLKHRVRSGLTMFGIALGTASVLAMMTFGSYAKEKLLESYADVGINTLQLSGYPAWRAVRLKPGQVPFREFSDKSDIPAIRKAFPNIQLVNPVISLGQITLTSNGIEQSNDINGIASTPLLERFANLEITQGRFLSSGHMETQSPVCVLGSDIQKKLYPRSSALQQFILVDINGASFQCQVIGTLAPTKVQYNGKSYDKYIIFPTSLIQIIASDWRTNINELQLEVDTVKGLDKLVEALPRFFQNRYGNTGQFFAYSNEIARNQMESALTLFSLTLMIISGVSMIVGGLGINNMMQVSVTERIKELGLRKALGATARHLLSQLVIEALLLAFFGSLIGASIGFFASEFIIWLASKFVEKIPFAWVLEPNAWILSIGFMMLVGFLSGLSPARRAGKLEIMEALRAE